MNWVDFSDAHATRQAANHAKARHLMLYLQETGKLTEVYKQFQAREVGTDSSKLLTDVLEVNGLAQMDESFQAWFHDIHDDAQDTHNKN